MARKQQKRKPLSDTTKGRPRGASHDVDVVRTTVTRCKRCGSDRREKYRNTRKKQGAGITRDGREYNWIVWRRTKCVDCGQHRDDVFHYLDLPDRLADGSKD